MIDRRPKTITIGVFVVEERGERGGLWLGGWSGGGEDGAEVRWGHY